jgi:hypothetical protein
MREWGETLRAHGIAARDVEEDPGGDGSADSGKETPGTRSGGPE